MAWFDFMFPWYLNNALLWWDSSSKFLAAQVTRALLAEGPESLADELQGDKKNVLVGGHSSLVTYKCVWYTHWLP